MGQVPTDKYEQELAACAKRLQAVLAIGEIKAVGLMEVATALEILIGERDRFQASHALLLDACKAARSYLRDFKESECQIEAVIYAQLTAAIQAGTA